MFFAVLGFLKALINPIESIAGKIADYKIAEQQASTDKERIAARERVSTLEARKAVLIAEAGSRINGFIRAGFALPFVLYNAKLIIWDKMLALGSTDGLSAELFQIELACIGFYFLYDITARLKR